jgi:hypothetical protein
MFDFERLLEEGIVAEVEHAKAQIHAGSEPGVIFAEFLSVEWLFSNR